MNLFPVEKPGNQQKLEFLVTRNVDCPTKCKFERLTPLEVEKAKETMPKEKGETNQEARTKACSTNPCLQGDSSTAKSRPILDVERLKNMVISTVSQNLRIPSSKTSLNMHEMPSLTDVDNDDGFVFVNINRKPVVDENDELSVIKTMEADVNDEKSRKATCKSETASTRSKSEHHKRDHKKTPSKDKSDEVKDKREAKRSKKWPTNNQRSNESSNMTSDKVRFLALS